MRKITSSPPVIGKHFVYVLHRVDGLALKVGVSSGLTKRFRSLNRSNGPFCDERSRVLRTDTRREARRFEKMVEILFEDQNLIAPKGQHTNGETEWYSAKAYDDIIASLEAAAARRYGSRPKSHLTQLRISDFAPIREADLPCVEAFRDRLTEMQRQIEARASNTDAAKAFHTLVHEMDADLIGVVRTNRNPDRFELYYRPSTVSWEHVRSLFTAMFVEAHNANFSAGVNLIEEHFRIPSFSRFTIVFPSLSEILEESWESRGYLARYHSLLTDLASAVVSPEIVPYVGRSALDMLPPEQLGQPFVDWLGARRDL